MPISQISLHLWIAGRVWQSRDLRKVGTLQWAQRHFECLWSSLPCSLQPYPPHLGTSWESGSHNAGSYWPSRCPQRRGSVWSIPGSSCRTLCWSSSAPAGREGFRPSSLSYALRAILRVVVVVVVGVGPISCRFRPNVGRGTLVLPCSLWSPGLCPGCWLCPKCYSHALCLAICPFIIGLVVTF